MSNPAWKWNDLGFLAPPTKIERLRKPQLMYRAWGVFSKEMGNPNGIGLFLSLEQPKTRREAEALFSIFEYGNEAHFVTIFKVSAGAPVWLGRVDPGDDYLNEFGNPGTQVVIEREFVKTYVRKVQSGIRLENDMGKNFVVSNRDGDRRSS